MSMHWICSSRVTPCHCVLTEFIYNMHWQDMDWEDLDRNFISLSLVHLSEVKGLQVLHIITHTTVLVGLIPLPM